MAVPRKHSRTTSSEFRLEELEPRVLFSADLPAVALGMMPAADASQAALVSGQETVAQITVTEASAGDISPTTIKELVIVDAGVRDIDAILADLALNSEAARQVVVMGESATDGTNALSQLSDVLGNYRGLQAVHLISHGAAGELSFGGERVDTLDLLANAASIERWRDSLAPGADFLIYGCDVAAGATGEAFVETLSLLSGADVAASTDLTGGARAGGNWAFEYSHGDIQHGLAVSDQLQETYQESFATYIVSSLADSGTGSLREAIELANASSIEKGVIEFSGLSGGKGAINLLTPLPSIRDTVIIDATTATGYVDVPVVTIDGRGLGTNSNAIIGNYIGDDLPVTSAPYEIVFVDTGIENYQLLLDDLQNDTQTRNLEVILLDSTRDGIAQITEALNQKLDVDAVHIISHGSDQSVQLGSTHLSQNNVDEFSGQISQWQSALSETADLLLYGCDLAANASGQSLLKSLSELTLADVTASTDLTGAASLGGDWNLEYEIGQIDSDVVISSQAQNDWSALLDITSDLVVKLAFEESSGNTATNSTANSNDGTWFNAPMFSNDSAVGDRSYDFSLDVSGNNAYVEVTDYASLDLSADFSVAFWYNAAAAPSANVQLIGQYSLGDGFFIYATSDGNLQFLVDGDSGIANVQFVGGFISDGNWHHVVASRGGDSFQLSVNGVGFTVTPSTGIGTVTTTEPLLIGGSSSDDYEGKLDDVRVYSRALSSSDVTELYNDTGAPNPQTYTVINTNDSGTGSLRQAIIDANANLGADTIDFNIVGSGTQIIALASALDTITEQVAIDATTQTGWSEGSFLPVVIDLGGIVGDGLSFSANSDNSEVRGLVIRDVGDTAIEIADAADGITVAGNWIGQFNSDGTVAGAGKANSLGVRTYGDNTTIGGSTAEDRNVISGNVYGVIVRGTSTGSAVSGNYIGTDISGNALLASTGYGLLATESVVNLTIGGATSAHGNVIAGTGFGAIRLFGENVDGNSIQYNSVGVSDNGLISLGNSETGIFVSYGGDNNQILDNVIAGTGYSAIEIDGQSTGNVIKGNYIGTDTTQTYTWGNGENGIWLENNADNNTIGGVGIGEGNVIAYSGTNSLRYDAGVSIQDTSTGNSIRGNSIYGNVGIGIDLSPGPYDGVDANDSGDVDTGANDFQNWAVLKSVSVADDGTFGYELDTTTLASGTYTIDFYASTDRDDGDVEGERYLGSLIGVASGDSSLSGTLSGITLASGEYVTLVTTDANGNSSEFSRYAVVVDSDPGGSTPSDLQVTATTDGSLRVNGDGGNDIYLAPDDSGAILDSLDSLSLEFDVLVNSTSVAHLFDYAVTDSDNELAVQINTGGNVLVFIGGTAHQFSSTVDSLNFNDGVRRTIGVTWDRITGDLSLYADGKLQQTQAGASIGYSLESGGSLVLLNDQSPVGGFATNRVVTGDLYRVRVFDEARTEAQMVASYSSELPHDEAGMVAQWNFDNYSSDGVITDSVSGNNLSVTHVLQSGFTASEASLTLSVNENALDGTHVGAVNGLDAEREQRIATLLAADSDLRYSAETGKFYKLVAANLDWTAANSAALSTNLDGTSGQLMTIRSANENQIAIGFYAQLNDNFWLGATDSTVEGEWRWQEDGSDADKFWSGDGNGYAISKTYNKFNGATNPDNTPSNGDPDGEDRLIMWTSAGVWNDAYNAFNASYVVEWNADEVLDTTQVLTYGILTQTVAGAFNIDASTGQITVADGILLDFEANSTHTLSIRTTDVDGNTYDEAIVVSIGDLAESNNAPTNLSSGIELNTDSGNDAYLVASDGDVILGGLDAFTLETSVRFEGTPEELFASLVIYTADESPVGNAINFIAYNTGALSLNIENVNVTSSVATAQIFDGQLHHLAVSWDNTNGDVYFFVDGELIDQQTGLQTSSVTSDGAGNAELYLGQYIRNESATVAELYPFYGTYHDVRIWNEVRSHAEISLNYQNKFDVGSLPSGLIANWQMDGFNGSSEVVDVVSGNNLSVGHATGTGFIASTPVEDLHVSENAINGDSAGFVVPSDPDVSNDILSDGLFLEATNPGSFQTYSFGQTLGDWTVRSGTIDYIGSALEESPSGGRSVHLNGTGPGGIYQTLDTEIGKQYQVTFALSGDWSAGEVVRDIRLAFGGESQDVSIAEPSGWSMSNMLWEQRSFTFTADQLTTDLDFISLDLATARGAVIADIQVIEVPDPITTILNSDPTLIYDAGIGKFYQHVNTNNLWQTALSAAIANELNGVPGQLLTIRSSYENDVVQAFAIADNNSGVWIGAADQNVEGAWHWYDGNNESEIFWQGGGAGSAEPGSYENWLPGQPDDLSSVQDYAILSSDGQWMDYSNGNFYGFVVEWDASEVLSNYSFSLLDDAEGRFALDTNTGEITVADAYGLDYENAVSHNVSVQVTDAAGNTYTETMTIAVSNGIEPTQSVPNVQSVTEDDVLTFSTGNANAVTVSDTVGSIDSPLYVFISVDDGVLTLSQTTGLTFLGGSNNSTFMTIRGTESELNAAFEGMMFTPDADFDGAVTLNMSTFLEIDLIGHYEFDVDADDSSVGTTQHGVLNGDAMIVTDVTRGEVLRLDGDDDFVLITGLMEEPNNVTMSAWINVTSTDGNGSVVISMGGAPALYLESDGRLTGEYISNSSTHAITSTETLIGTGWRHVAMSVNTISQELTIYIDGSIVDTAEAPATIAYVNNTNTYIGRSGFGVGGYDLDGLIDDARIYGRALSDDEINALALDQTLSSDSFSITVNAVNDVPSFDLPGQVVYTEGAFGYGQNDDIHVMSDGSMLISPYDSVGNSVLVKLTVGGSVDTSFGVSGFADNTTIGYIQGITEQADSKILVTGKNGGDVFLARYNDDGTLDTSFGSSGVATIDNATLDDAGNLSVQSDGKIVVVGEDGNDSFVARFNTDGTLDTSFDTDGIATFNLGDTFEQLNFVAIQLDGKIIAGGEWSIIRLNTDGSLDTAFDADGILATGNTVSTVNLQTDGKIVAIGSNGTTLLVSRFESDGSIDSTFGSGGTATWNHPTEDTTGTGLVQQSDGKWVAVGHTKSFPSDWVAVRFNIDGSVDTTFADNGAWIMEGSEEFSEPYSLGLYDIGTSEKIILGGYASNHVASATTTVVRLNHNGSLDDSIGTNSLDGNSTFVENGSAVVLDANTEIFDPELSASDDFSGSTLTLMRNGAANSDDVFSTAGNLVLNTGTLELSSTDVGSYTNVAGQLVLSFGSGATNAQVNEVLQSIAYENISDSPPVNVQIDWVFDDGNSGAQGSGVAAQVTGNTVVSITSVNDAPVINNPNLIVNGDLETNDLTGWATTGTVGAATSTLRFGVGDVAGPHTASQTFTTVAGQAYTISFQYRDSSVAKNQQVTIDIDGSTNLLSETITSSTTGTSFVTQNYSFVADSTTTLLMFTDISSESVSVDGYIDNVSVVENASFNSITEDDINNAGQSIASVIASHSDDIIIDGDAGAIEGIAITNYDESSYNGWFEYSLDSGTNWTRMGYYTDSSALLLRATDLVRFVPQGAGSETGSLTFRAWDQTSGAAGNVVSTVVNGGSSAFSTQTETVSITTTDINDAPQFGSPDPGVSTYTASDIDGSDVSDVVLLNDGSKVVVGTDSNDIVLTKFNADGTVDTSFGAVGLVRAGFSTAVDYGYAIDVDSSNRLVVVGELYNGTDYDGIVMRFNADGSTDTTFATAGVYTYSGVGSDAFNDVVVLAGDKILAAGENNADAMVVRLNADGSLDTTFNSDGIVTFDLESGGSTEKINAIDLQSDGKVIVAGEFSDAVYVTGFVTRLTTTGVVDTTFGATGTVSTTFGLAGDIKGITDVLVLADDKIVIAGAEDNIWHWGMTRFNADGSLDTSFDTDGHVVESFGGNWGDIAGVEQQLDGQLVVAGYIAFDDKSQSDWVLARYNQDGSLDSSYGDEGVALPQVGYYWNEIYSTAMAPDDTLVVAGYTSHTDSTTIGHFGTDGSLDSTMQSGALDGNPTFVEGSSPAVLDADIYVFDRDLSNGNYAGTTLTLVRTIAASSDDVFTATGTLGALTEGGNLIVNGTTIGTVTSNSGGMLVLSLNSAATQSRVNEAVSQIAYSNMSDTPPSSVQIDWTFSDGNTGAQGSGGALIATGSTTVNITAVNDAPVLDLDVDDSVALGADFSASWMEGSGPVLIADVDATLVDDDQANLASVSVTITNLLDGAAEVLAANTSGTSIVASYDSGIGVLTLSSANAVADYQQVLRTITYDNTFTHPNETARIITVQASDGIDSGNIGTSTVTVTGSVAAGVTISALSVQDIGEQATVSELPAYADANYLSQAVALSADGSSVTVWTSDAGQDGDSGSIMARLFDAQGIPVGSEFVVNSTGTGWQDEANVAMDAAGNFVVSWTSRNQDGSSSGVYAQRFTGAGVAQGSEFLVNTTTTGMQAYSSVAMADNGSFVIAWEGNGIGDSSGVFAQRFDAAGVAQGGEFLINETTTDTQAFVAIASDGEGNVVATWTSRNQDGSGRGVYLHRFDSAGNSLGGEQLVNTLTTGDQWLSGVAMNDNGEFVVGWRESGQASGILFQLYNADGSAKGGPIDVPSSPAIGANYPQLAIDDKGYVTVVWQDFVDADDNGIVARQFDSVGIALGAQFIVNTHEQWYQQYPSIAMNGVGQLLVVFSDYDANGDADFSVEMRRFGTATTEAGGTTSFSYVLDTQPTDDVTITLTMPDSTEGTLSTTTLTFTSANWNSAQVVTVTGVEDSLADGNLTHLLVASNASSIDTDYNGLVVRDVSIANLDNDPSLDLDADDSAGMGIDYIASFTENTGPVAVVDVDASLIDPDSATLASITVTISNLLDGANEILAADTSGTTIVATYTSGTGVLSLSGSHSVEGYEQVLRSVTYNNTSENPDATPRVLTFVASDGSHVSPVASTTVSVNAFNDAPIITSDGGGATAAVSIAENMSAVTTVTSTDVDSPAVGYSIVGGADQSLFSIDGSSGNLNFIAAPDYEAALDAGGNNIYDVIVRVSDGSLFDDQAIAITVTDVSNFLIVDAATDLNDSGITTNATRTIEWLNANKGADDLISLREAIFAANNTTGTDTISFNIAGMGVQTINLASSLPDITDAVTIDGYTQSGASANTLAVGNDAVINIELNGGGVATHGLRLTSTSSGSSILGLAISNFRNSGLLILGGNNVISGNFVGLNADGATIQGNQLYGINIANSSGNTIGGTSEGDRNVVSGNTVFGIALSNVNASVIQGNYVGTDKSGTLDIGSAAFGIYLADTAANNTIGGSAVGAGNVISGNTRVGIQLDGSSNLVAGNLFGLDASGTAVVANSSSNINVSGSNNTIGGTSAGDRNVMSGTSSATAHGISIAGGSGTIVQGNYIGTDITGTVAIGNAGAGISVTSASTDTIIGGTVAGAGNVIANSGLAGIQANSTTANFTALGNVIFGNTGLGIDLVGGMETNGVTANDVDDIDTGPNGLQNYPVLAEAFSTGGNTTISGTFNSSASTTYRIEFFSSPSGEWAGYGEDQTYLGFATLSTDGSGNATINELLSGVSITPGHVVSATATVDLGGGSYGDTSEFAANVVATYNTAPTLDNTQSPIITAINEDAGAPIGSVGTLISDLVDFALPSGQMDNVTDPDAGAVLGIAITAADTTDGAWHYSIDGGSNWNALGAVSNTSARLLAADANTRVYFEPDADYNGSLPTAIAFRAWDQFSGSNGALADTSNNGVGTAYSNNTDTASLVVNAINDAPVLNPIGSQSVDENTTLSFSATASDSDDPADTVSYGLDAASIALGMSIDADTGAFSWTPTESQGGTTPTVTITVTDDGTGTLSDAETFTITVNDTNTAPVLGPIGDKSIEENTTLSFNVTASDSDNPSDTLTYNLDAASITLGMSIDANTGAFSWTPEESQGGITPSVTITVTDDGAGTLSVAETFTITVNDTNSALIFDSVSNQSIDENSTLNYTATATDSDDPADTLTYSISGGADQDAFAIDSITGVLTFVSVPNYEVKDAYEVQITASDGNGSTGLQILTVTINDINESPTVTDTKFNLTANFQGTIGQLLATDPDSGDVLVFQLLADEFAQTPNPFVLSETGVLSTYEPEAGSYQFQIKVIDTAGLEASAWLTLIVDSVVDLAAASPLPIIDLSVGESIEIEKVIANSPTTASSSMPAEKWTAERESRLDKSPLRQIDEEQQRTNVSSNSNKPVVGPASEFVSIDINVPDTFELDRSTTRREQLVVIEFLIETLTDGQNALPGSFTSLFGIAIQPLSFSIELIDQLDLIRSEVETKEIDDAIKQTITTTAGTVVTATLSVGFATWLIQSGLLVASALSTTPLWRSMDPMPILMAGSESEDDTDPSDDVGDKLAPDNSTRRPKGGQ